MIEVRTEPNMLNAYVALRVARINANDCIPCEVELKLKEVLLEELDDIKKRVLKIIYGDKSNE